MKKSTLFFLFISFIIFNACQDDPVDEDMVSDIPVTLLCEKTSSDETMPRSALYAIINQGKTKIASISVCDTIGPKRYTEFQIPQKAVAAAGGWWAGSADYFYAIERNGEIEFLHAEIDEMQETPGFQYRKIASYKDGRFDVRIKNSLSDFVGLYTAGGHEQSWVFFLGMNGEKLDAHFFEIDGMLPPKEDLVTALPSFEPQILERFEINMDNLTFESDLGKGQFGESESGKIITFFDKESHISDRLVLHKMY